MTMTANPAQVTAERRIAFVRLPQAIDVTNDSVVLDSLAAALAERPSVVIADGTLTGFCDCAGISALVRAHRLAAAAGAQLRLVAASPPVRRVITLTAADNLLDTYLTIGDALADMTGSHFARTSGAPASC
jgi:anti-anti-sigma factor